ncbi:hypothetical protein [Streptomyces sp. NPDC005573]|uniref:hypothetical protein n=1 Tax=Streptomyces sp. NPDC005573 TaxID=3156890 RepID=UPI0033B13489
MSSPHASGAAPHLLAGVDLTLPVEKYLFSTAEQKELQSAQDVLAARCVKGFGLHYEVPASGSDAGPRSLMDRRYGVTDEKMAAAFGYHLGDIDPRKVKTANPDLPKGDALVVLTGRSGKVTKSGVLVNGKKVAPGGCFRTAREAIFGKSKGNTSIDDFPQDLNRQSFFASKSSPDVVRVFKAWSNCMKKRGFSYPDPLTVADDKRFRGADPVPAEIEVARADVGCKKETNLVGVWFSVETRFEEGAIRQNASRLNRELEKKKEVLAAASDVVRKADG